MLFTTQFANMQTCLWKSDFKCNYCNTISFSTSQEAGKAASLAKDKKFKKYRCLNNDFYVVPVAIENLGSYGPHALDFIKDVIIIFLILLVNGP